MRLRHALPLALVLAAVNSHKQMVSEELEIEVDELVTEEITSWAEPKMKQADAKEFAKLD
jgi:hypothetical protein